MAEEIIIDIKVLDKDNDKKVNDLTKRINELNNANRLLVDINKKIVSSGNQNSKAHIENSKQIEINKQKINELNSSRRGLIQTIGLEDTSIKGLRLRNAELIKQRDVISVKTKEGREAIDRLNKEIDENNDLIRRNVSLLEQQKINIGNYPKIIGQAIKAFTAFLAAAGITQFIRNVIDITAQFQKLSAVLTNTLGSRSEAQKALRDIQEFAAKTPFSVIELTDSFVKLTNQGFKPTNEELRKLGDLASSQAKGFDQLTEAIIDAQTGEFERLKEFGIRAKKEGDNVTFTFKGVETQTKFTSESIREYIISLGDLAGVSGSMAAISGTLSGKISNLGDNVDALLNFIGTKTSGLIGGIIDLANFALGSLNSALTDNIGNLQKEQAEINLLTKAAIDLNTPTEVRASLLQELNSKYPDFLKNLDLEKVTNEQLAERLDDVNKQFLRKIALVSAQEALAKIQDQITMSVLKERDARKIIAELDANRGRSINVPTAGVVTGTTQGPTTEERIASQQRIINNLAEDRNELQKELLSLTEDLTAALNIYSDASKDYFEKDAAAVQEKEKVDQKAIDKALEARKKLNEQLAELQVEEFEAELARRREFEDLFNLAKIDSNKAALDKISEDQRAANEKTVKDAQTYAKKQIQIEQLKNQLIGEGIDIITQKNVVARVGLNALFKSDAIGKAWLNVNEAATKALTAGPFLGPILAGLIYTAGVARITTMLGIQFAKGGIAAAKKGVSKTGALLSGKSHAQGGIPFSVGGAIGFEAEGGEAIINKRSTAMFRDELSAINQAGGGVPFATGGITGEETRIAARRAEQQIDINQFASIINRIQTVLVLEEFETKVNSVNTAKRKAEVLS